MLLKKAERVIKEKGISALKIKVVNRLKYKTASLKYAYTHKLLPIEIAKQRERKYKIPVKISICVPVYNVDKNISEKCWSLCYRKPIATGNFALLTAVQTSSLT